MCHIPPELLGAIAQPGGGHVVIIVGAGCSFEPPTSLPLSGTCAQEAHRKLRADGVLTEDCEDPNDLSCVADAVVLATGFQRELVNRLPREEFRLAEPNEGYLMAAALLRERALSNMMTLNFDLSMSSALTQMGSRGDVAVVAGPEEHHNLGTVNLIYLHRNVNAEPERWILRSSALDTEWMDNWEEVIVRRVLGAPVTVFAGLGTPADVLVETTRRIRAPLGERVRIYLVDPGHREASAFFAGLELPEESYIQMGWGAFMKALADRLIEEYRVKLENACNALLAENAWEAEDVDQLCMHLTQHGLVEVGRIRARWLLDNSAYVPCDHYNVRWIADLLLAVGLIERVTGSQAIFGTDGVVEFRAEKRILGAVVLAHGRGDFRWGALEAKMALNERHHRHRDPQPCCAIVSGFLGERPVRVTPPRNIVLEEETASIVTGDTTFEVVSVDRLRGGPNLMLGMLN